MTFPTIDLSRITVRKLGDVTVVSGPRGCGKTTLIRCLVAHLQPDEVYWCKRGDGLRLWNIRTSKPSGVKAVVFDALSINVGEFAKSHPGLPVIVELDHD